MNLPEISICNRLFAGTGDTPPVLSDTFTCGDIAQRRYFPLFAARRHRRSYLESSTTGIDTSVLLSFPTQFFSLGSRIPRKDISETDLCC